MLSYRHAFHAGNHADVLKHLVLVLLLDYLTAKPKPLWVVETHAGAGIYDLERGFATQLTEHTTGISRLWDEPAQTPALGRYVTLVRQLNPDGRPTRYPGSPWLARQLTRTNDRLWLYELHPADFAALARNLGGKGVRISQEDGCRRRASCPSRCGSRARNWLDARLQVRKEGPGMYGSGMLVILPLVHAARNARACAGCARAAPGAGCRRRPAARVGHRLSGFAGQPMGSTPKSAQIFRQRRLLISVCRGTAERAPVAGFTHHEWRPPSLTNSQPWLRK